MKYILLITVLFLGFSSQAFEDESYVCPDNNKIYKGISCCLDSVSFNECKQIIDQKIPERVLNSIKELQENYANEEYLYGRVPNCFWNTLNFKELILDESPYIIESTEFIKILSGGKDIQKRETVLPGDIVVFNGVGKTRGDDFINGKIIRRWAPFEQVMHAGIALKKGLVFQKENIGSGFFSIDSLENSKKAYSKGMRKLPLRGRIELEFFR